MSEELQIAAEMTPNPNTLKFTINRQLLESGSKNFINKFTAVDSPLAAQLFDLGNIAGVMIGTDFVTVTKTPEADWLETGPYVAKRLREFFDSGTEVFAPGAAVAVDPAAPDRTEIEKKIIEILDTEVRPAVARDGGDIVFYGFDNGVVKLHLQGACSSCPSSIMTLKFGIENRLKQSIPEVKEVLQV